MTGRPAPSRLDLLCIALEQQVSCSAGELSPITNAPICAVCDKRAANVEELRREWRVFLGVIAGPPGKRVIRIYACSRLHLLRAIAYAEELGFPAGTLPRPPAEPEPAAAVETKA